MTPEEWKKLKKRMPAWRDKIRRTNCTICGGEITEDDKGEDVEYSKAHGTHVFYHKRCLTPQGGIHAKQ